MIRPQHINSQGRLFGGFLLQWIDEVAGVVGRRHSGHAVITASIDNLSFRAGAYQDDMVVLSGKITYTGRTSMEIRVDAYVEDYQRKRKSINSAYVVMVAVDKAGKPVPVPALTVETEAEQKEWEAGKKRYDLRQKHREEGY